MVGDGILVWLESRAVHREPIQKQLPPEAGLEQVEGLYPWVQKNLNSTVLLSSLSCAIMHRNTSTDKLVTSELLGSQHSPGAELEHCHAEHSLEEVPIPSEIKLCSLSDVSIAARNPLHEAAVALPLF